MSPTFSLAIQTLRDAGHSYGAIATQLKLTKSTVAKHGQKNSLEGLPPKIKKYQGKLQGRNQLKVKQFILANPLATLSEIHEHMDKLFSVSTIHRYLKHVKSGRFKDENEGVEAPPSDPSQNAGPMDGNLDGT